MATSLITHIMRSIILNNDLTSEQKIQKIKDTFDEEMNLSNIFRHEYVEKNASDNRYYLKYEKIFLVDDLYFEKTKNEIHQETDSLAVNYNGYCGFRLLHACVEIGDQVTAEWLITQQGAKINLVNDVKNTPLHIALQYKKFAMARYFLAKGADVCLVNKEDKTPLFLMMDLNQLEILKQCIVSNPTLIKTRFSQDRDFFSDSIDLLEYAVRKGNLPAVKMLLKYGAKQQSDFDGENLLKMTESMLKVVINGSNDLFDNLNAYAYFFIFPKKKLGANLLAADNIKEIITELKSHSATLTPARASLSGWFKPAVIAAAAVGATALAAHYMSNRNGR